MRLGEKRFSAFSALLYSTTNASSTFNFDINLHTYINQRSNVRLARWNQFPAGRALISRAKFVQEIGWFRVPLVHTFRNVFGSPKTFRILANFFYFVRSFCFCYYHSNYELNVVTFSSSFRHFVLLCFRDLPVNRFNFNFLLLILTHCTQFQLFALNFNFQRCFGIYLRFLSQWACWNFCIHFITRNKRFAKWEKGNWNTHRNLWKETKEGKSKTRNFMNTKLVQVRVFCQFIIQFWEKIIRSKKTLSYRFVWFVITSWFWPPENSPPS